jgi:hypothetical protein
MSGRRCSECRVGFGTFEKPIAVGDALYHITCWQRRITRAEADSPTPSPGGPTAEPVMAMTVEKCGRCRGTSIDAVTEGPCTFNCTGGYWYTEEQLHGRDALVMDWARKTLAYTKAATVEPPTDLATWTKLDAERIVAWKALRSFDASGSPAPVDRSAEPKKVLVIDTGESLAQKAIRLSAGDQSAEGECPACGGFGFDGVGRCPKGCPAPVSRPEPEAKCPECGGHGVMVVGDQCPCMTGPHGWSCCVDEANHGPPSREEVPCAVCSGRPEPRTGGPWLRVPQEFQSAAEDDPMDGWGLVWFAEAKAQRAESTALRSRLADVEPELSAIAYRVRKDDCCPTANNEGDEGEATYICLGEDGTPIIEADRLADVVAGIIHCWGKTQDRAERAEARLADVVKERDALRELVRVAFHDGVVFGSPFTGQTRDNLVEHYWSASAVRVKLASLTPGGDRGT